MWEALALLGATVVISLSGVMMPGPVTAGAIAKGAEDKKAGIKIALGHALIEFPIIALVAVGLTFIASWEAKAVIGVVGGILLIYLGIQLFRPIDEEEKRFPYKPTMVGVITSAANPYFFIWWATVGAALITRALEYGVLFLVVFAIVHWSCDLMWDSFLTLSSHSTLDYWHKHRRKVFAACGAIMLIFGVWFIVSPFI
ncbi:MAG: LysE family transporter [Candidatus Thermoplasmatota archaeon]|nr:LysE family transporter [Candidatus Thermoplasmatota archaeon]